MQRFCTTRRTKTPFARLDCVRGPFDPHTTAPTHTTTDVQPTAWPAYTCPARLPLHHACRVCLTHRTDAAPCVPTHTATGVAATPCATPRAFALHHTCTTCVACRLSPAPAHARRTLLVCDPHALSPSCSAEQQLSKGKTNQGTHWPFATQHPRRPAPHTPRAIPAAPLTTHSNRCKDHNMRCSSTSR